MALIKCHECGGDVSNGAKACPKCGAEPKKSVLKKKIGCLPGCLLIFLIFFIFALIDGPSSTSNPTPELRATTGKSEIRVSKEQYGDNWPATVKEGIIQCRGVGSVVFVAPSGLTYGLNGTAMTTKKFRDFAEIWRDDPKNSELGNKVNIGDFIQQGLKLCK